jgi:hypothetical protein
MGGRLSTDLSTQDVHAALVCFRLRATRAVGGKVLGELEAAVADSLRHLVGGRHKPAPPPGATCANCNAILQGPFCHVCGQNADTHKRSILHLIWEAIEDLFHLDGRLLRTLPDLFLRPGRLARDYMESRIARHVPPFRTFLVALLLFIFAAEHATHEGAKESERQAQVRAATLATPQGRAAEAVRLRVEAAQERNDGLKEAANDRLDDLKDPDESRVRIAAAYAKATTRAQTRYAEALAKADRVAKGLPTEPDVAATAGPSGEVAKTGSWWKIGLRKATANPEYYLTVMFTWGQRIAILLLPIVGLSLALVYRNKRQYFIYDHLLVAMNFLSFVFLTNALGLVLPSPLMFYWLGFVAIWTPINLFQTLRGAYASSMLGAILKTLVVWSTTVFAFSVLLMAVLIFSLAQL